MELLLGHNYRDSSGKMYSESLRQHVRSVAEICGDTLLTGGFQNTGFLLGLLHDMGKSDPAVQQYLRSASERNGETSGILMKKGPDHSSLGAMWLWSRYCMEKGGTTFITLLAAVLECHHSGRRNLIDPDGRDRFYAKYCGCRPGMNGGLSQASCEYIEEKREAVNRYYIECASEAELDGLVKASLKEYQSFEEKLRRGPRKRYDKFIIENGQGDASAKLTEQQIKRKQEAARLYKIEQTFYEGMLERYLYSALIDADWYATYCFCEGKTTQRHMIPEWDTLARETEGFLSHLQPRHEIDHLRQRISDQCFSAADACSGIYRLYVPTGGGKTFSGLRYCIREAQQENASHVFYFAPYKSIISQNADEFRKVLGEDNILEHHSDVIIPETTPDMDEETRSRLELLHMQMDRWTDKPVIATSLVQFENIMFSAPRSSIRRMASFAGSVMIFDEIQSIPAKHSHLFNLAINFLHEILGCTIVLCTATQPPLDESRIPVHYADRKDLVESYEDDFERFRRTRICFHIDHYYSDSETAEFVLNLLNEDVNSILLIMNTKETAINTFRIIRDRLEQMQWEDSQCCPVVYCLTTNQCRAHINDNIAEVQKIAAAHGKVICVSTQLIEAGVDLSVDCVVRCLAGLPSIAQAAGRCNRHGEQKLRDVHVISKEEKLEHLEEIEQGERATRKTLAQLGEGDDPLSPKAMDMYYRNLAHILSARDDSENSVLDYRVSLQGGVINTNLVDMLSRNVKAVKNAVEEDGIDSIVKKYYIYRPIQAFQSADNAFTAIEGFGLPVIVPYGKGKELIKAMCGDDRRATLDALKHASSYTVPVSEWMIRHAGNAIYHPPAAEMQDVFILADICYDAEGEGVCTDRDVDSVNDHLL